MFLVFGNRVGLHLSPLLSDQPALHNPPDPTLPLSSARSPSSRMSENCLGPDLGSRQRWIRIIPKHLQNISVFLFGLPTYVFLYRSIMIGGTIYP